MRVPNFSFDTRLYQGDTTLIYAGVREQDLAPVIGKVFTDPRRNLHSELAMMQKAAGPGVAEALGIFDGSEGPVLVQRRFGDGHLASALRGKPLPVRRVLNIGLQLARAFARIHAAGVLHRDVKPANVLWDSSSDAVQVADFGSATPLPLGGRTLPVSDLVGTPAYISPEQTGRTHHGCDARSDLYSLGVTLYQLLTGTLPFAGSELLELIAAQLATKPEPPELRAAGIPHMLSALVMKLLAKAPDERYQSARGLAADLATCLEKLAPDGSIETFELGRSDLVRLKPPARVYGREAELEQLSNAFERAAAGEGSLVLLSGREAWDRNAVREQLLRSSAPDSLWAVGGWSTAGQRPLSGISDALNDFASRCLLFDDRELRGLRRQLMAALGQVGQVMVDIAPALGDVLGPQPELTQLGPVEARSRLQHAFRRFAQAAGEERVFVLALSNVEYADAASLQLLQTLLDSAEQSRLLVLLDASSPDAFGALRSRPSALSIELGPLSSQALKQWTADALECGVDRARELADVLRDKSGGHAGSFWSLLEHFVESGVIAREGGVYTWDIESVRQAKAPPSLDALAWQRAAELPSAARAVLAAIGCAGPEGCDLATLAVVLERSPEVLQDSVGALERAGLVERKEAALQIVHPKVADSAVADLSSERRADLRGRLGVHWLRTLAPPELKAHAMRVIAALSDHDAGLTPLERIAAARLAGLAAEQAMAVMAYETAAAFCARGSEWLGAGGWDSQPDLAFSLAISSSRALTMLAEHARAEQLLKSLCERKLSAYEMGIVYPTRVDNYTSMMDRDGAIVVGLEGLARVGYPIPLEPAREDGVNLLIQNQRTLAGMSLKDHTKLKDATDEHALAAIKIISNMAGPAGTTGRGSLYLLSLELGLQLHLQHGHTRYYASYLSVHAVILHSRLGNFDAARSCYEACQAVQKARPSPELDGRTYLVLYYQLFPWLGPWRDSLGPLTQGVQMAIEAGDQMMGALSASGSITLMLMLGTPFDRVVAAVEGLASIIKADAGVAANAANVLNIAGKLARGEAIVQSDLDRISNVSAAAGSMRNNALVNLALPLMIIGHEAQVRTWIEEARVTFPMVNIAQPHIVSLWLLEGLLAAKDMRAGQPERVADVERAIANLRKLEEQTKTDNHQPSIMLLEAELARSRGEIDRASGLFGRATHEAKRRDLVHVAGYALEQRAQMCEQAGLSDDAALFYREALIAYRRWMNLTKVRQLEAAHPELRALETSRGDTARTGSRHLLTGSRTGTMPEQSSVNEALDLATVLKISQEISTQLHADGVVRSVLAGIAQNAGAERALFIVRDPNGREIVHGEFQHGEYTPLNRPVNDYTELPLSVWRVARRTHRAVLVADAIADPSHMSDPFVIERRCRSIAVVPILRKGVLAGCVVLENRLAAGAFTSSVIGLIQALVAQAAISLDNASLYENMESRIRERTAALDARNTEMRMVLDNVSQGLITVDRAGRLSSEGSAIFKRWFAGDVPETLHALFANDLMFGISWEQLIDDFLPRELCIEQLPKRLRRGPQIFEIDWQPITDAAGELVRMLVVLSDITEARRRQAAEQEQKQIMALFEHLSEDYNGVVEFTREAGRIVSELEAGLSSPDVEKRLLHTLKGNTALFGQTGLSTLCHEIESAIALDDRPLSRTELTEIANAWRAIHSRIARFIDVSGGFLQVRRADFEVALRTLEREGHPLAAELELWKLEALETRFQRVAEQAQSLAQRLGKLPVRVYIEHNNIRINPERWAPLWAAFVHAIRNAVDHGLETAAERSSLGKGPSTLRLRGFFSGMRFVIELSDDGRGIAWDKVRERARTAGLPANTHDELLAALLSDGVSTRDAISELSGRGVGMGALRAACAALGGRITVESSEGHGTTWSFEFPREVAKAPRDRRTSRIPPAHPAE